ncbi:MAG: hypothetical protein JWL70_2158 [Acidimicrobiia bacterium]|nr:hypothetical protein [Acidimicrobiia bacterium]
MITTGSKLFFAATAAAILAALIFIFGSRHTGIFTGAWILITFAVALAFLGGIMSWFRDADPSLAQVQASSAADAEGRVAAAGPVVTPAAWPAVAAIGAVLTLIGLVYERRMFVLGILIMAMALVEWMVLAWADRYSPDPAANASVRARIMRPFEFPVLGVIVGFFVVIGFSRVMLALTETASVVVFGVVASAIFAIAILLSLRPQMKRAIVTTVLGIGAVAVFAGGVASATVGEHHVNVETECTKDFGPNAVSNKSALLAEIRLTGNAASLTELVSPYATPVSIRFINKSGGDERFLLTTEDGKAVAKETCPVGNEQSALLTLRFARPGVYHYGTEAHPNLGTLRVL